MEALFHQTRQNPENRSWIATIFNTGGAVALSLDTRAIVQTGAFLWKIIRGTRGYQSTNSNTILAQWKRQYYVLAADEVQLTRIIWHGLRLFPSGPDKVQSTRCFRNGGSLSLGCGLRFALDSVVCETDFLLFDSFG